ncbi:MAG TPA: molybdopterin-dependent oxidoreductase, partial [Acidimicrobiales bacterium]
MTDAAARSLPAEGLAAYPDPSTWDDVVALDAKDWPRRTERHFTLVPTTCFNCEANCGLVAWIDKETGEIAKLEGNPLHPASRGRNCAKGPATVNQIKDTERILHPMRRIGRRGEGRWEQVSWDEALADIGGRIGRAFREGRHDEVLYHVGRPGDDSYVERVLHAWGIDGHNSHTNICSSGARFGYAAWMGFDRPSADYANAKVIFLISSHLEAGHYFNPHAQRIMEGRERGAKIVCVDPRLSNTGSVADWWLPAWPGTEPVLLLAIARLLLENGTWDRDFVRRWVNWETYLRAVHPDREPAFDGVAPALMDQWAEHTPERAAEICGIEARSIREIADVIGANLGALATHNWRAAGAGNLGGWQTARCLWLLNVLTGSVGTVGGTSPNGWNKFIPIPPRHTEPQGRWNEITWAPEYPLAHHEMSFLLPHFLREGRGKVDTYFTRVYNPVWTNPDGCSWIEALTDEDLVGCHVALTPTWSETAWFADYVLPMGLAAERHDVASYETHSGRWIGFRQPVMRRYAELVGAPVESTREANPGEVWEENEFWIALSWHIDPEGELGIRRHFESLDRPDEPMGIDEYYEHLFTHSIPGLPEASAADGLSPLEYMRRRGAFAIPGDQYQVHERELTPDELAGTLADEDGVHRTPGTAGLHRSLD